MVRRQRGRVARRQQAQGRGDRDDGEPVIIDGPFVEGKEVVDLATPAAMEAGAKHLLKRGYR